MTSAIHSLFLFTYQLLRLIGLFRSYVTRHFCKRSFWSTVGTLELLWISPRSKRRKSLVQIQAIFIDFMTLNFVKILGWLKKKFKNSFLLLKVAKKGQTGFWRDWWRIWFWWRSQWFQLEVTSCVLCWKVRNVIAKTLYPFSTPFRFQSLFDFFSAMSYKTSEPIVSPYPSKSDHWPSTKWRHLEAPFSRF